MINGNSANANKCLKVGAWGASIFIVCCFTPVLVVGLSMVGLGVLSGYLDYVLLPALGVFLMLAVYGLYHRKRKARLLMEECCHEPTQPPTASCPWCGKRGQAVRRVTVEALTHPDDARVLDLMQCFFCNAPSCDVVYFSVGEKEVITKNRLRVRAGIKETVDPIPLCYCFNFDRKAIWQDIWSRGATDIPKIITERIKAGECRCEVTNPSGRCCLGDVYHAIKQAKALDNHPAA